MAVKRVKQTEKASTQVRVPAIQSGKITLTIRGVTPLIQHKWSQKAIDMIKEKQSGRKTKQRDPRNPEAEFEAATHRTEDGQFALPAMAIKASLISAAHKDLGIEKTLVKKSLFMNCPDANDCIPMTCSEPRMREDMVRIGNNAADLRYRPEFKEWSAQITFYFDAGLLQVGDIVNLLNRAGFGIGVGEWRPEKGGEYGRFEVLEEVA